MDDNQKKAVELAAELTFDIADQISIQEKDCLLKILWRFGIKKVVLADFNKVIRKDFDNRKNYWEYWYPLTKELNYLLMSRELTVTVKDGIPDIKLQIDFNPELVVNNEL